jgi:hypothetical protein
MFSGPTCKIGDKEYIVPALSLGQLRGGMLKKLQDHDTFVAEGKLFDTMTLRGEIIIAALRRNYPDLDENVIWDNLDMSNTGPVWLAVLGASGFTEPTAPPAVKTNGATPPQAPEPPLPSGTSSQSIAA